MEHYPVVQKESKLNGKAPPDQAKIVEASAALNEAVTRLKDIAVDTKIQSDSLHEQITGHPPPRRD